MDNKQSTAVVVETKPRWSRKKKIVFAVVAVLSLTGIVAAVALSRPEEQVGIGPGYKQTEFDTAQALADSGKKDEANKLIDDQIAKATDSKEKAELISQKASLASNAGDKDQALALAQEAYKTSETFISAKLIAVTAEQQGNKALAIEYYKKTIELMNKQSPMYSTDKENYEAIIAELQK